MDKFISEYSIKLARNVNLYDFLLTQRPDSVNKVDGGLRLFLHPSVFIREGGFRYEDSADNTRGNAIDCLMFYLDYSFPDAVEALCYFAGAPLDD